MIKDASHMQSSKALLHAHHLIGFIGNSSGCQNIFFLAQHTDFVMPTIGQIPFFQRLFCSEINIWENILLLFGF